MKYCPRCGSKRKEGTNFCSACGTKYDGETGGGVKRAEAPRRAEAYEKTAGHRVAARYSTSSISNNDPSEKSRFLDAVQKKYAAPLVLITIAMAAGIVLFTTANTKNPHLEKPVQLQLMDDGGVIIASTHGLVRFDRNGDQEWKVSSPGGRKFDSLVNFDFGPDGNIYAANPYNNTYEVITPAGEWLKSVETGTKASNFALLVLDSGNIMIADSRSHRLKLFGPEGNELKTVGRRGVGPYDLRFPNGAAQLPDGRVFVADTNNQRFQVLDRDLNFIQSLPFSRKAIAPGSKSEDRVIISYDGEETRNPGFFSCRVLADPARGRLYVAFADEFVKPYGYVGIFDFDGKFLDRSFLKTAEGENVYPYTMRLTPDGKVSVGNTDKYTAGIWDPDTGRFSKTDNPGAVAAMEKMKRAAMNNRLLYRVGMAMFGFGLVVVIGLVGFAYSKEQAGGRTSEKMERLVREERVAARPAEGGDLWQREYLTDEDFKKLKWKITKQVLGLMSPLVFETLVITGILVAITAMPKAMRETIILVSMFLTTAVMIFTVVGIFLVMLKKTFRETQTLYVKNKAYRFFGDQFAALEESGEVFMEAAAVRSPGGVAFDALLLLTGGRLVWTGSSSSSALFSGKAAFKSMPLKEINDVRVNKANYMGMYGTSKITVYPLNGKKLVFQAFLAAEGERLARAAKELIGRLPQAPGGSAGLGTYRVCPECSGEVPPGSRTCPHCGLRFRDPRVAALLSLALCGLGQFYNRQYLKGAAFSIPLLIDASSIYIHFSNTAVADPKWMAMTVALHVVATLVSAREAYRDAQNLEE